MLLGFNGPSPIDYSIKLANQSNLYTSVISSQDLFKTLTIPMAHIVFLLKLKHNNHLLYDGINKLDPSAWCIQDIKYMGSHSGQAGYAQFLHCENIICECYHKNGQSTTHSFYETLRRVQRIQFQSEIVTTLSHSGCHSYKEEEGRTLGNTLITNP